MGEEACWRRGDVLFLYFFFCVVGHGEMDACK